MTLLNVERNNMSFNKINKSPLNNKENKESKENENDIRFLEASKEEEIVDNYIHSHENNILKINNSIQEEIKVNKSMEENKNKIFGSYNIK